MDEIARLNAPARIKLTVLFNALNFCFATKQPGRAPSLYFTSGGPNRLQTGRPNGRLRVDHGSGPAIEIHTTKTTHWFYDDEDEFDDAYDWVVAGRRQGMNYAQLSAQQQTAAARGDIHFEHNYSTNLGRATWYHASGGDVYLTRSVNNTQDVMRLANLMLRNGAPLRIDGQRVNAGQGHGNAILNMPHSVGAMMAFARQNGA